MRTNLQRLLLAVALIAPASSAFADVITDWNEKAVAFVTGKMAPAAGQRIVDHHARRDVRCRQLH